MQTIPERKEVLLYHTAGSSMFPFIRWREYLVVKKTVPATLKKDDIIVYQENGGYPVCHRILRIENQRGERWFHTKGDGNSEEDAPIRGEIIIGKVIAIRKKNRLIACSSPEWSSTYADATPYLVACGIIHLKNRLKKTISSFI